VISRYLVIALAIGAAGLRASQGEWIAAGGLASLAAGLIALRLAPTYPQLKRAAYVAFAITAGAMILYFMRQS
jgi:hypothetical protein